MSSYWRFFAHLIWATKGRELLIGDVEEAVIRRSWNRTLRDMEVIPHAIGLVPDHVHLVLTVPPKIAIADLVHRLKGASSHAVNHQHTVQSAGVFRWQPEYGGLTFGEGALPRVIAYVENQRDHHARNELWPTLERITEEQ